MTACAAPAARPLTTLPAQVTMRDDSLPHQIRLTFTKGRVQQIAVSCTCLATGVSGTAGPAYRLLEARDRWDDPAEPMRIWRAHMAGVCPGATTQEGIFCWQTQVSG